MPETFRRVIARPDEVDDADWTRLGEVLAEAVGKQRQLAAESPHVLQFTGDLGRQETGRAYFVEHEPASAMPVGGLFNKSAPPLHESQLLRVTVALFDALRKAHAAEGQRPFAHGAVCPGTVLFVPDGVAKLTDFGFAPALCAVLGPEQYINLAVGPPEPDSPAETAAGLTTTGCWEVLTPDEFERDDRICAFVDPEKYGAHELTGFEAASDVIAAAFILHLLAEHEHPYLYAEPDAHRMVEMSEFMAMARYNGSRRQELRESDNEGTRQWCSLMADALARLSKNRPSAGKIVDALAAHVTPEDADDLLRQKLIALEESARKEEWDEVREEARRLAENAAAPTDVVQRAGALLVQAEANALIAQARRELDGPDWPAASKPIEAALAMSGLPADLSSQAHEIADVVNRNLRAQQVLDDVEADTPRVDRSDPIAAAELMGGHVTRLGELDADRTLLVPVRSRLAEIQQAASAVLDEVMPAAEAVLAEERAQAAQWLEGLESSLAGEAWDELEALLSNRPRLRRWPTEVTKRAQDIQRRLDDYRAEQKWSDAIQTDHAAAQEWIEQVRQAVTGEQWQAAETLFEDKPRLTYWPEEVLDEANRLSARLRAAHRQQEDEERARQWAGQLKQAVESEQWDAAADLLGQRPTLPAWPTGLLEEVAPYQQQVEARVEAAELEQRRLQQRSRLVDTWLEQAAEAVRKEQWVEALNLLDAPPPVESVPDDAQAKIAEMKAQCRGQLGEEIKQRLDARGSAARALARALLADLLAERFEHLIRPEALEVAIDAVEILIDHPTADGRGLLRFRASEAAPDAPEAAFSCRFHFQVDREPQGIDDPDALREALSKQLSDLVGPLQQASMGRLVETLREGLFPEAEVDADLGQPSERTVVKLRLFGAKSGSPRLEAELVWDATSLTWQFADPGEFARRAIQAAADVIGERMAKTVLERSEMLQHHRSLLTMVAVPSIRPDISGLPKRLKMQGRVLIRPGAPVDPQTLQSFPLTCKRVDQVACDVDLSQAESKIGQIVAEAQRQSHERLTTELEARLEASAANVRLDTEPRRIEEPVGKINFRLQAKGRDPWTLSAPWDAQSLAFFLPEGWEERLTGFLLGSPMGPGGPEDDSVSGVTMPATRPTDGGKRKAIGLVGGVAGLAIIIGAWAFWPNGQPGPTPGPVDPKPISNNTTTLVSNNDDATKQPPVKNDNAGRDDPDEQTTKTPDKNGEDADAQKPPDDDKVVATTQPVQDDSTDTKMADAEDDPAQRAAEAARREAEAAHQAREDEFDKLEERVNTLVRQLRNPTHDDLRLLIADNSAVQIAEDLRQFEGQLPDEEEDLANQTTDLIKEVNGSAEQLTEYEGILAMSGYPIAEQLERLQTARDDAWATDHVKDLLAKLPPVDDLLTTAKQLGSDGNWRATRHFFNQAQAAAADSGLTDQVQGALQEFHKNSERERKADLRPKIAEADGWLTTAGPPPEPLVHLAQIDTAEQARTHLDGLDLDFPTGTAASEVAEAAVDQAVFPWPALQDQERQTIQGLLDWTGPVLTIPSADGAAGAPLELTFIPGTPAYPAVWMSQTEITVAQYKAVMGNLPSQAVGNAALLADESNPIAFIPAGEVLAFRNALADRLGGEITIRVPYAREWQHALLAGRSKLLDGNPQVFTYDQDGLASFDLRKSNQLSDEYDRNEGFFPGHQDGFNRYAPVKSFPPNQWQVYQLLGNVHEWVSGRSGGKLDAVGGSFAESSATTDQPPQPARKDQARAFEDVGLRLVVLPPAG